MVRKGRPAVDDYFASDVAPVNEPLDPADDDTQYGVYDFSQNSLGSGPFFRNGSAILGFDKPIVDIDTFVPDSIPPELENDAWMMRCAMSAADYNRRLLYNRPTSFLDLHTNVEQTSQSTQPNRVYVLKDSDAVLNFDYTDPQITSTPISEFSPNWKLVSDSSEQTKYPIALLNGQYRGCISAFRDRFKDTDSPYYVQPDQAIVNDVLFDLPSDLHGALPFRAPGRVLRSQLAVEVEPEPPAETFDASLCVNCQKVSSPTVKPKIPQEFLLKCTKCKSNYHPTCIQFDDPILVSRVLVYDWECSTCKLCVVCVAAGDDAKLLFCDICDRGFHTYCLPTPLNALPQGKNI